ncbi:MAG: ABATE domain-containing protein [Pyrinomonadaceae bacterium]
MEKVETALKIDPSKFHIVGNNLSLDFLNTVIAANGKPLDLLENWADLAAWTIAARLLEPAQAEKFLESWSGKKESEAEFNLAIEFREVLREMILAIKKGTKVKPKIIKAINEMLNHKNGTVEIEQTADGFEKRFHAAFNNPRQLLAPVAESATDLLCYANPALIKKCEARECVLYFYDATKNHSRRWCSMAACGNRAKAASFYRRQKLKSASEQNRSNK